MECKFSDFPLNGEVSATFFCRLIPIGISKAVRESQLLAGPHHGVDNQSDAKEYEGYAEELAHVEHHCLLELDLGILYEFYEEAWQEDADEEDSEDESRTLFGILFPVHPHQQAEECEIAQSLVDLRRVAGLTVIELVVRNLS